MGVVREKQETWDAVGLVYRDHRGPQVLSDFQGLKSTLSYDDFLNLPGIQAVKLRKLTSKSNFIRENFKEKAMQKHASNWVKSSDGVDIVRLYLQETGLGTGEDYSSVEEMEGKVLVKPELGKYGPGAVIWTEDSQAEVKHY